MEGMEKISSLSYEYDILPQSIKNEFKRLNWDEGNPFFYSIKTKYCNVYHVKHDVLGFTNKYAYSESWQYLIPYIDIYGKGFYDGYMSFVETIKNQTTELFSANNEIYSRTVYLRTRHDTGMLMHCFLGEFDEESCYNSGKKAGEYYKAWEIIFKNPEMFECFFLEENENQPEENNNQLIRSRKTKFILPVIDKTKYNPDKIYEKFNNFVFRCSKDCFNAWLVDGNEHPEKIKYVLKGRKSVKTGLETLNYAQLRKFINTITGDAINTKDAYYKAVFDLTFKTSTRKPSNQFKQWKVLKGCEIKKK